MLNILHVVLLACVSLVLAQPANTTLHLTTSSVPLTSSAASTTVLFSTSTPASAIVTTSTLANGTIPISTTVRSNVSTTGLINGTTLAPNGTAPFPTGTPLATPPGTFPQVPGTTIALPPGAPQPFVSSLNPNSNVQLGSSVSLVIGNFPQRVNDSIRFRARVSNGVGSVSFDSIQLLGQSGNNPLMSTFNVQIPNNISASFYGQSQIGVFLVINGREALEYLAQAPIHLVSAPMDDGRPRIETISTTRASAESPTTVTITLTRWPPLNSSISGAMGIFRNNDASDIFVVNASSVSQITIGGVLKTTVSATFPPIPVRWVGQVALGVAPMINFRIIETLGQMIPFFVEGPAPVTILSISPSNRGPLSGGVRIAVAMNGLPFLTGMSTTNIRIEYVPVPQPAAVPPPPQMGSSSGPSGSSQPAGSQPASGSPMQTSPAPASGTPVGNTQPSSGSQPQQTPQPGQNNTQPAPAASAALNISDATVVPVSSASIRSDGAVVVEFVVPPARIPGVAGFSISVVSNPVRSALIHFNYFNGSFISSVRPPSSQAQATTPITIQVAGLSAASSSYIFWVSLVMVPTIRSLAVAQDITVVGGSIVQLAANLSVPGLQPGTYMIQVETRRLSDNFTLPVMMNEFQITGAVIPVVRKVEPNSIGASSGTIVNILIQNLPPTLSNVAPSSISVFFGDRVGTNARVLSVVGTDLSVTVSSPQLSVSGGTIPFRVQLSYPPQLGGNVNIDGPAMGVFDQNRPRVAVSVPNEGPATGGFLAAAAFNYMIDPSVNLSRFYANFQFGHGRNTSSSLIILTNQAEVANRLSDPRFVQQVGPEGVGVLTTLLQRLASTFQQFLPSNPPPSGTPPSNVGASGAPPASGIGSSPPGGSVPLSGSPIGSSPAGSQPVPPGSSPFGSSPSGSAPPGTSPSGSAPSGTGPSGSSSLGTSGTGPMPSGTLPGSGTPVSGSQPVGSSPQGTAFQGSGPIGTTPSGQGSPSSGSSDQSSLSQSLGQFAIALFMVPVPPEGFSGATNATLCLRDQGCLDPFIINLRPDPSGAGVVQFASPSRADVLGGSNCEVRLGNFAVVGSSSDVSVVIVLDSSSSINASVVAVSSTFESTLVVFRVPPLCSSASSCTIRTGITVRVSPRRLPSNNASFSFEYFDSRAANVQGFEPSSLFVTSTNEVIAARLSNFNPTRISEISVSLVPSGSSSSISCTVVSYGASPQFAGQVVVSFRTPASAVAAGTATISVGITGRTPATFTFNFLAAPSGAASVIFVDRLSGPLGGGFSILAQLSNFLRVLSPQEVRVRLSGFETDLDVQSVQSSTTSTSVRFGMPPAQSAGNVTISISPRASSSNVASFVFAYVDSSRPTVSFIFPSIVVAGASNVIVSVRVANALPVGPSPPALPSSIVTSINGPVGTSGRVQQGAANGADGSVSIDFSLTVGSQMGAINISIGTNGSLVGPRVAFAIVNIVSATTPLITFINPASASIDGGIDVRIFVSNVPSNLNRTSDFVATIGGSACPISAVSRTVDATTITCRVPSASAAGPAMLVVRQATDSSRNVSTPFSYIQSASMSVTSLFPSTGSIAGNYPGTITIVNVNRQGVQAAEAVVLFGETTATVQRVENRLDGSILVAFVVPAGSVGRSTITFYLSSNPVRTVSVSFLYFDSSLPQIVEVRPSEGETSGDTLVNIRLRNAGSYDSSSGFAAYFGSSIGSISLFSRQGSEASIVLRSPSVQSSGTVTCQLALPNSAGNLTFNFLYRDASRPFVSLVSPPEVGAAGGSLLFVEITNFPVITSVDGVLMSTSSGVILGSIQSVHYSNPLRTRLAILVNDLSESITTTTSLSVTLTPVSSSSRAVTFSLSIKAISVTVDSITPSSGPSTGGWESLVVIRDLPRIVSASDLFIDVDGVSVTNIRILYSNNERTGLGITIPSLTTTSGTVTASIFPKSGSSRGLTFSLSVFDGTVPRVQFVSSRQGIAAGGEIVSINIDNVPPSTAAAAISVSWRGSTVQVGNFNLRPSNNPASSGVAAFTVTVPSGPVGSATVIISVSSREVGRFTYTYLDNSEPAIIGFAPNAALTSGGSQMSIVVRNVNATASSDVAASLDNVVTLTVNSISRISSNVVRIVVTLPATDRVGAATIRVALTSNASVVVTASGFSIVQGCNYKTFCSESQGGQVPNNRLLQQSPPVVADCIPIYCIDAASIVPPSITFVSVSTGPMTGGTACSVVARNLIVSSSSELTVRVGSSTFASITSFSTLPGDLVSIAFLTPAVSSAGLVSIAITGERINLVFQFAFETVLSGPPVVRAYGPNSVIQNVATAISLDLANIAVITNRSSTTAVQFSVGSSTTQIPSRIAFSSPLGTKVEFTLPAQATAGNVTVTVTAASSTSTTSFVITVVAPPSPSVTAFPTSGPTSGNVPVLIRAVNFPSGGLRVTQSGNILPIVSSQSDGISVSIYINTPQTSASTVSLVVTSLADSTKTASFQFQYTQSTFIQSLSPRDGPAAGGTVVRALLRNAVGVTAATVAVNSVAATNVRVESAGADRALVTFTTPAASTAGTVTGAITVNGTSVTFSFSYIQLPPVLSPSSVPIAGGVSVAVTVPVAFPSAVAANVTLLLSGEVVAADSVTSTTASSVTFSFTVPAVSSARTILCSVTLGSYTNSFSLTYFAPPTMGPVLPSSGSIQGGQDISVTVYQFPMSTRFQLSCLFSGIEGRIRSLIVSTADVTSFIVRVPASNVSGDVTAIVSTSAVPSSQTSLLSASFTYNYIALQARVVGIIPDRIRASGNASMLISLANLPVASSVSDIACSIGGIPASVDRIVFFDSRGGAIVVRSPSGLSAGSSATLSVTVSQQSAYSSVFVFDDQVFITCIDSCIQPATSAPTMRIGLVGFSAIASVGDVRVSFGTRDGTVSSIISSNSTTTLLSIAPPDMSSSTFTDGLLQTTLTVSLVSDATKVVATPFLFVAVPAVVSSAFDPSGTRIFVRFDSATNSGGFGPSRFFCSSVFASASSLGSGAYCSFPEPRALLVYLGRGATILPSDTLTFSGSIRSLGGLSSGSTASITIQAPSFLPSPSIIVLTRNQIGACDGAVIRALAFSPRPMQYVWSCSSDASVNNLLSQVTSDVVRLSSSDLPTIDFTYVITVQARDFLGATSELRTIAIQKISLAAPTVSILGPASAKAADDLILRADVAFSACPGPRTTMNFTWSNLGVDSAAVVPSNVLSAIRGPLFFVRGRVLSAGVYRIALDSVVASDASRAARSTFNITIEASDLAARFRFGNRTVSSSAPFDLDASPSRDPDVAASAAQGLSFSWVCVTSDGSSCRSPSGSVLAISSASVSTVAANSLTAGVYYFTVTVSKDIRIATAVLSVTVIEAVVPSVLISSVDANLPIVDGAFRVSRSSRLRLSATSSINGSLTWSVANNALDLAAVSTLGVNSQFLVIRGESLEAGSSYDFTATIVTPLGAVGTASVSVRVNNPPSGGSCVVSTSNGTAFSTLFTVSCSNWGDTDQPLSYRYGFYPRGDNSSVVISDAILDPEASTYLAAGSWTLFVVVQDSLLAATSYQTIDVVVNANANVDYGSLMSDFVSAGQASKVAQFVAAYRPPTAGASRRLLQSQAASEVLSLLSGLQTSLRVNVITQGLAEETIGSLYVVTRTVAAFNSTSTVVAADVLNTAVTALVGVSISNDTAGKAFDVLNALHVAARASSLSDSEQRTVVPQLLSASRVVARAVLFARVEGESLSYSFSASSQLARRLLLSSFSGRSATPHSGSATWTFPSTWPSDISSATGSIDLMYQTLNTPVARSLAAASITFATAQYSVAMAVSAASSDSDLSTTSVSVVLPVAAGSLSASQARALSTKATCLVWIQGNWNSSRCTVSAATSSSVTCSCPGFFQVAAGFDSSIVACGDGLRQSGEDCDDGNLLSGDGCSSTCRVESPYTCTDMVRLVQSVSHAESMNLTLAACTSAATCSGKGNCSSVGTCMCEAGYFGGSCALSGTIRSQISAPISGASGGQIRLTASAKEGIDIPAGAFVGNVTIGIVELDNTAAPAPADTKLKLSGSVKDFKPDGQRFLVPVTIKLAAADATILSRAVGSTFGIYFYNTTSNVWEKVTLGAAVDTANGVVSAQTDHFSLYGVMEELSVVGQTLNVLGIGVGVGVGGGVGLIIIIVVIVVMVRRKRRIHQNTQPLHP